MNRNEIQKLINTVESKVAWLAEEMKKGGHFDSALGQAMIYADLSNLRKIVRAFPEKLEGYLEEMGIDVLHGGVGMKSKMVVIIVEESKDEKHGYIPCVVTEGMEGYRPLSGADEFAAPWYWGNDKKIAQKIADDYNKGLGLSEEEIVSIVRTWYPQYDN
jgi:hypothetical protein